RNQKSEQNGASVEITDVLVTRERWVVQVSIAMQPNGYPFDSSENWPINNRMVLVHKKTKEEWLPSAYARENSTERKATVSYHFTDRNRLARTKPEDWSLVYHSPEKCVSVDIPFVFEKVELP